VAFGYVLALAYLNAFLMYHLVVRLGVG